ncbi:Hypothetical predicted protein [Mytilus galloprovincialis]|uniref:Uncharacterized protein n=1 Tax=Mytilus galloprovincialis TaxID=29158 RepID=A0A8B6DD82_MYTGA|nr:Hypothetical predicted protein [Mytilus galloprovincialis]VDI17518.1 Hypothetical predicted protein [Mytilus galloprovincialis]
MDVASDYCGNVNDQRQFNNLQSSAAHVESVNESRQVINVPMQLKESVVIVSTVSRANRDIRIRLKQHRWSILAFVCGVVLALVIVVPLMVSKFSSTATDDKAGYLFSLRFDRKSAHSLMFMSNDNTVLGNSFSKETPISVNHPKPFTTYKGTKGDRCLTSTTKIYFEIMFSFKILKSINQDATSLVLEVGVASREEIDSNHYVGNHGLSFYINNCNTSICFIAIHGTTKTRKEIKIISSSNTVGTVATGRLGFFVNMERNEFSVIDKDSSKILFTFTKVVFAHQLCLAFGVYNPKTFETKLEIMYFLRF